MQQLETYLADVHLRGASPKTVSLYRLVLERFLNEFDKIEAGQCPLAFLMAYLSRWKNSRTRDVHFRAIKTFTRWQSKVGLGTDWVGTYRPAVPEAAQTPVLSMEQFQKLLSIIPQTVNGKRDRAFYTTLFYSGCRRDAIRLLKWKEVSIPERWMKITTKGLKEFIFPLAKPAARELNIWRLSCPSEDYVFPSTRRTEKPINDRESSRRIGIYAKMAGFDQRVYLHLLRHSHANLLDEAGISVQVIQAGLGHSHVKTTMTYLRKITAQRKLRNSIDEAFG